jgi:hypothetical protein
MQGGGKEKDGTLVVRAVKAIYHKNNRQQAHINKRSPQTKSKGNIFSIQRRYYILT